MFLTEFVMAGVLFIGPMLLSWGMTRVAGTRLSATSACVFAVFAASVLWGLGESYWIVRDVIVNGTDPIAGIGTVGAPPFAAGGAAIGAFIAIWPRRASVNMKRLALVLAGSAVGAALVSVAAAYGLFLWLFERAYN